MPVFEITVKYMEEYRLHIRAGSEKEAEDIALTLFHEHTASDGYVYDTETRGDLDEDTEADND